MSAEVVALDAATIFRLSRTSSSSRWSQGKPTVIFSIIAFMSPLAIAATIFHIIPKKQNVPFSVPMLTPDCHS